MLVVGNPCNTNALIGMENSPDLPRKNWHALTRLDENRAKVGGIQGGAFAAARRWWFVVLDFAVAADLALLARWACIWVGGDHMPTGVGEHMRMEN